MSLVPEDNSVIAASEAMAHFAELLDRVAQGEQLTITKGGKPVARLIPPASDVDRERAKEAIARMREARKGVTLGGLKVRDLIDEGRR